MKWLRRLFGRVKPATEAEEAAQTQIFVNGESLWTSRPVISYEDVRFAAQIDGVPVVAFSRRVLQEPTEVLEGESVPISDGMRFRVAHGWPPGRDGTPDATTP